MDGEEGRRDGHRRSQKVADERSRGDWEPTRLLALDDDAAMAKLGFIDAVADTVGGETAQKLLGKVKQGGVFASVLGPPGKRKDAPHGKD